MEEALAYLNTLADDLDFEDFYAISIRSGGVYLQGKYTEDLDLQLEILCYDKHTDMNNYITYINGIVQITLT
jgi:hypothetical protein